ncbi:DDE_3 domain-containing protein [Trichonephila clavipes]|nr:DDE_3 domain-containing protein [Trichonephila clavipes]
MEIFQQNNFPCQKVSIVLEWVEEHKREFQLMSCSPKLGDLNRIENIRVFIESQRRDQISSFQISLILCDHCLNNWYNLSPIFYQELVSIQRRIETVSQAEICAT